MNKKELIIGITIIVVSTLIGLVNISHAQFGGFWYPDSNNDLTPVDATWGVAIPSLTGGGPGICATIDASGVLGTTTCSGASGVTSVDMSVPTGLTISGNPITTSGTLAVSLDTGYVVPTSTRLVQHDSFYTTPSSRITAGNYISWSSNTLNVTDAWWNGDADITADAISESKISFSTTCGASSKLYVSGNDLACAADITGGGFATTSADYWAQNDLLLQELSDVESSPQANEVLYWSGSAWVGTGTSTWATAAGEAYASVCSDSSCDYQTDGTADDVQIQSALDAGNFVQLECGTYDITAPLVVSDNDVLKGRGVCTALNLANSVNDNVIESQGTGFTFFVRLQSFRINGNDANNTTSNGIHAYQAHSWIISEVHIDNMNNDGIHFEGTASFIALNNYVLNSRIEDSGEDAIEVGDYAPNNHIRGNIVDAAQNAGYGMNIKNTEIVIKGNHFHECGTHCLYFAGAGDNNIVDGNFLESLGASHGTGGSGIYVTAASTGNRITNNVLFNHDDYGIEILGDHNTIANNKAFDRQGTKTQDYGLSIASGADDNIVMGNDFSENLIGHYLDNGNNTVFWNNGTTTNNNLISTGLTTFSSNVSITGEMQIPNSTNPTADTVGEMALDTTKDQLIVADSSGTERVYGEATTSIMAFTVGSTSQMYIDSLIDVPQAYYGFTATGIWCYVEGGTSVVVNITDGTNDTNTITCDSTKETTSPTGYFTSNNTFTVGEVRDIELGTKTGSVNYLSITIVGHKTVE